MAVALEHGLITPIIRAAETKGLAQIAMEAKDLAARGRSKEAEARGIPGRHLHRFQPRHVRHQVVRLHHH